MDLPPGELTQLAGGQASSQRVEAALRRVAKLVAGGAPPEELFAAITEEAGRLLQADQTMMIRYEADGTVTLVAAWSERGDAIPLGAWKRLDAGNHITLLWQAPISPVPAVTRTPSAPRAWPLVRPASSASRSALATSWCTRDGDSPIAVARVRIEIPSARAGAGAHARSRSACSSHHAARETPVRTRRSRWGRLDPLADRHPPSLPAGVQETAAVAVLTARLLLLRRHSRGIPDS
jgi:GAF domain-containing protein